MKKNIRFKGVKENVESGTTQHKRTMKGGRSSGVRPNIHPVLWKLKYR